MKVTRSSVRRTNHWHVSRRRFLAATTVGLGLLGCSAEEAAEGKDSEKPLPQNPNPDVLRGDWTADGDPEWDAANLLAQLSKAAYATEDQYSEVAKALGFKRHSTFSVASMTGAIARDNDLCVLVFRGTDEVEDWLANLDVRSRNTKDGKVHAGFFAAYQALQTDVQRAVNGANHAHLWITGHSLGGALAVLAANDLVASHGNVLKGVVTFGQPMVAKPDFAQHLESALAGRHQRFVNGSDVVPRIPPFYQHTGELVWIKGGTVVAKRSRQFGASPAEDLLAESEGPPPLSEADFKSLQRDLQKTENVDEVNTEPLRTFGGSLPWLQDHGMDLYLEQIDAHRGPSQLR